VSRQRPAHIRGLLLFIDDEMIGAVPRTSAREIRRYKAYARHVRASASAGSAIEKGLQL
jgi:hypothetical protein